MSSELREARKLTGKIARSIEPPRFYREKGREVERSRRMLKSSPIVRECLGLVEERNGSKGHGVIHVRKVAVDAGAIALVESDSVLPKAEVRRMVFLAHVAGVLHDIRRFEKEHARASAAEAGVLLVRFNLSEREIMAITGAIGNHEAFNAADALTDPLAQFLSDALYDADKFRWGPDNFTEMLWDIVEYRNAELDDVMKRFPKGMAGIERIRETFRTRTGKIYGPDFIDRGIEIGMKFYAIMTNPNT